MAIIKEKNKKIISLLKRGKTQWEVHKMGYPFGTVRYHYMKMYKPEQFESFMKKHKERMKKRYKADTKLSTSKAKK
jgi:hypothetical protein